MIKVNSKILIALCIFSLQSLAQTGDSVRFIGIDSNWFEPTNWSSGMVPDANTNLLLTSGQSVVIDPALAPTAMPIMINNIILNGAILSTLPGTVFHYNNLIMDYASLFDTQSSEILGNELKINQNGTKPGPIGMRLNPTTNDNRSIKITANSSKLTLFLGGNIAASPGNVGVGHYATLAADDIELNGNLEIDTIYGFQPQVGDVFEIIKARQNFTGAFNNYREGDVVASFNGVHLVLSYEANTDGSISVLLTASDDFSVFVGPGTDWNDPENWSNGILPLDVDDVVIASGQSAVMTKLGSVAEPYFVSKIQGKEGSRLEIQQSIVEVSGTINGDIVSTLSLIESSLTSSGVNANSSTNKEYNSSSNNRPWGGLKLNPSQLIVNDEAQLGETAMTFVLGGLLAADENNTGIGFYGNIIAQDITLGSSLTIETKYGFQPQVGDVFEIINTSHLSGRFNGLSEGDIVSSFEHISLIISYQDGDGNDVTLTAVTSNDLIFRNGFEQ